MMSSRSHTVGRCQHTSALSCRGLMPTGGRLTLIQVPSLGCPWQIQKVEIQKTWPLKTVLLPAGLKDQKYETVDRRSSVDTSLIVANQLPADALEVPRASSRIQSDKKMETWWRIKFHEQTAIVKRRRKVVWLTEHPEISPSLCCMVRWSRAWGISSWRISNLTPAVDERPATCRARGICAQHAAH